jgi:hypothetical protein
MAISPEVLTQSFKREADDFEKIIDNTLSSKSLGPGGSITINTPRGMTSKHFEILSERYKSAGWSEIGRSYGSQRDPGDWLTFKL